MIDIVSHLYIAIPLLASLCNLFLLLTFLSARKDKLIRSFMMMLIALTVWPLASLFMRLGFFPGEVFWFQLSMTAIICVPLSFFMFLHRYTKTRGFLLTLFFNAGTVIMVVLNLMQIFIRNFHITELSSGQATLSYDITWASVFLLLFSAAEICASFMLIYRSVSRGGLASNNFRPLFWGIAIMGAAMLLDLIPGLASVLPVDPFACMINALLVYYMLYKKRVFALTQLASSASTYLISMVLTTLTLFSCYRGLDELFANHLHNLIPYKALITAVFFSIFTILVFTLLKKLANNIFIRGKQAREDSLKNFSYAINKTLDEKEIVRVFTDVIRENVDVEIGYIFVRDSDGKYRIAACTDKMRSKASALTEDSAVIRWMRSNRESISYSSFKYTANYKSMWESEKSLFVRLQVEMIVPILYDEDLVGLVLLSGKRSGKDYSFAELSFIESAASMVSIAMKNADLYATIREEAHLDHLTNLYNRRYFTEKVGEILAANKQNNVTLMLLNFDDFKLYNELYGSVDGDAAIVQFANVLRYIVGSRGVISRYGGKEFAVCLPQCGSHDAELIVEDIRDRMNSVMNASLSEGKKFLTFSAGICTYPSAASTAKQMFTYANMAVDLAKKTGKNKTVVYTQGGNNLRDLSMQNIESIGQEYASTIYALTAAIDAKDHYTFNHSKNVSYLATQLAQAIGLDEEHVEMIRQAALLHDIGKISIPEHILTKKDRLTGEEYEIIKGHVTNAISMIRHLPSLDYVIPIAISHHERYDGAGYPRGLAGENIPVGGRCLAVADAFDAIVSKRPYKDEKPISEALFEIDRNLGRQFDPNIGRAFVDYVRSGIIKTDCYSR